MNLHKETRQKTLADIIRNQKTKTQHQLLEAMQQLGIETTQASLSRDIAELGVVKENGVYVLHTEATSPEERMQILSIQGAGPHLLVVKSAFGMASAIAIAIDQASIEGVVGTVAGDDTILVALHNMRKSSIIKKAIIQHFRRPLKEH